MASILRAFGSAALRRHLLFGSQGRCFSSTQYDVVVVGGGPGGYVSAIKAAHLGLKAACVEKRGALGGTCLNVGCVPSKALLNISHKFREARDNFEGMGINVSDVGMDLQKMQAHKGKIVSGLTGGIEFLFKKNKVDYFKGEGHLSSPTSVTVSGADGSTSTLKTSNIILATGSESSPFPGGGLKVDEKIILSSTGALELTSVPKHLVVVGAGVIGLELGSVWRALGSKVTVVEFLNRCVPAVDLEVGAAFQKILAKEGIEFQFQQKVSGADVREDGATIHLESVDGTRSSIEADKVLVAVGRRPFTTGLGLEGLNIKLDSRGRVVVDECMRVPNHPNIRAIGDLIAGPMLAHKAEEEGLAVVEEIAGKGPAHVNYAAIPSVVYTHPELAGVGRTEEELKADNVAYAKGVFPFSANSRARATGETDGFVKVLVDKETDKILGAWIIGSNAGELIAEVVLAFEYGGSSEDLGRTCHAHPTFSEAIKEACMACYGKAIHIP